ncbi:hypothetical protein L195_g008034 [Trifolium pratense]|uniref:Uncharacterized protein n=1 Tax=Trifolium pratense TaxID=57577 RepID=A0A2K3NJ60_TRIPR|nr:hypothetical protein L195_g026390 [Trifolium pratense]PNY03088.1 hypothetical protein L195_g026411 [Trifolium pratense]PNY11428.1 hypothetical protein L195_g008034 [Trifolium pratense]
MARRVMSGKWRQWQVVGWRIVSDECREVFGGDGNSGGGGGK